MSYHLSIVLPPNSNFSTKDFRKWGFEEWSVIVCELVFAKKMKRRKTNFAPYPPTSGGHDYFWL